MSNGVFKFELTRLPAWSEFVHGLNGTMPNCP
jgi:hypothetical protein